MRADQHRDRASGWLLTRCLIGTGLLGIYLATATYSGVSIDVVSSALAAWRIANTGEPWLDGVPLASLAAESGLSLWTGVAENGHVAVFRSPGAIAAAIPPYLISSDGTSVEDFSVAPVAVWAAAMTAGAMLLLLAAVEPHLPRPQAVVGVLGLALTTPVWSVASDTLWTHTVTVLGIAGMAWAAARERWWLVGMCGGVALWGRLHAVLIVAILGLLVAWWQRRPQIALQAGLVSGMLLFLAAAWSRWVYGEWDPAGGYPTADVYATNAADGDRREQLLNYLGLLLSPDRGLLVWTPLLAVLLPAVIRSWPGLPDWVRALALGGVAYAATQGLMNHFAGGDTFYGYRLMLEPLVCAAPAYILSAGRAGRVARRLLSPLLALQFAMISLGAITNTFLLPVDDAWSDSSLLYALREFPVLGLWVALVILVGWLSGRLWSRRSSSAPPEVGEPAVSPGEHA